MSLTFDPAPSNLNDVQKGSLGGGIVTPLGLPFTLDVEAPDDATIGFSFPSITVPTDASLVYLYETRDGGGNFVGYLRAVLCVPAPIVATLIALIHRLDRDREGFAADAIRIELARRSCGTRWWHTQRPSASLRWVLRCG